MKRSHFSAFSLSRPLLVFGLLFGALPILAQATAEQDASAAQAEHTTQFHAQRAARSEEHTSELQSQ